MVEFTFTGISRHENREYCFKQARDHIILAIMFLGQIHQRRKQEKLDLMVRDINRILKKEEETNSSFGRRYSWK